MIKGIVLLPKEANKCHLRGISEFFVMIIATILVGTLVFIGIFSLLQNSRLLK